MARSVNKAILIGNLGADPELRNLPSGAKVASFNLATNENYTNKAGELVEQTEWHRIELWDKLADIAMQYLKKGNTVYIEGRIRTEEWTDKDGVSRRTTKIRATEMTLLGGGKGTEEGPAPAAANPAPRVMAQPTPVPAELAGNGDDLPF